MANNPRIARLLMLAEQFKGTDRYNRIMESVDNLSMADAMATARGNQEDDDYMSGDDPERDWDDREYKADL